jgi:hypothetical protein
VRLTNRGRGVVVGLMLAGIAVLAHQHAGDGHLEKRYGQVVTVHEEDTSTAPWDDDTSTDGPSGMGPAMCGAEDPGQPCWSPTGGAVSQGPIGYTLDTCKDGQTSEWNQEHGYGKLWVCHPSK